MTLRHRTSTMQCEPACRSLAHCAVPPGGTLLIESIAPNPGRTSEPCERSPVAVNKSKPVLCWALASLSATGQIRFGYSGLSDNCLMLYSEPCSCWLCGSPQLIVQMPGGAGLAGLTVWPGLQPVCWRMLFHSMAAVARGAPYSVSAIALAEYFLLMLLRYSRCPHRHF